MLALPMLLIACPAVALVCVVATIARSGQWLVWASVDLAVLAAFLIAADLATERIRIRLALPNLNCAKCDYALVGNQNGVCPECGASMSQRQIRLLHNEKLRKAAEAGLPNYVPRFVGLLAPAIVALGATGIHLIAVWQTMEPDSHYEIVMKASRLFGVVVALTMFAAMMYLGSVARLRSNERCMTCRRWLRESDDMLCRACDASATS